MAERNSRIGAQPKAPAYQPTNSLCSVRAATQTFCTRNEGLRSPPFQSQERSSSRSALVVYFVDGYEGAWFVKGQGPKDKGFDETKAQRCAADA